MTLYKCSHGHTINRIKPNHAGNKAGEKNKGKQRDKKNCKIVKGAVSVELSS